MNIIDLPDREHVRGPGAYRCSMAHYHSQAICPGPSISSTGLRTIYQQSPWHFWSTSSLNPDRFPEKPDTDALILGKATHALVLGDDEFDEQFIFVPEDAPQRPTATQVAAFERDGHWSEAAKPRAKFWEGFDKRSAGRMMLSAEQVEKIGHMSRNIRRNEVAVTSLTGALTEISLIWQDDRTGVWLKSRPDVIPDNGYDFGDLKTFAPRTKSIIRAVHQAITDNAYHMQMALAVMGAEAVFGKTASNCILTMAQSTEPYTISPVRIDEDALYWGRIQLRSAIDSFAECLSTGVWPMPVPGILEYSLPPSLETRLSDMQANGDLPNDDEDSDG